jgi:hypothetical protein
MPCKAWGIGWPSLWPTTNSSGRALRDQCRLKDAIDRIDQAVKRLTDWIELFAYVDALEVALGKSHL